MRAYQTAAPSVEEYQRRTRAKGGRKRSTPVTLASVHALLADAMPVADLRLAQLGDDYEDREQLTGEARKRAQLRRVALALQGDPLGISTGEYAERPRYGVGEVTAERMQKVQRASGWVGLEQEKTAKGADTGLQRRRIKSVIEVWFERGAISKASWLAAQALQRDHDLSLSCTASLIAKYQATVGVAHRELMGQELQVEFAKAKALALRSVDPIDRPIADWIIASSNDNMPWQPVARRYFPEKKNDQDLSTAFRTLLERTCASLARHYQHKESHRWLPKMAQAVTELAGLVPA